MVAEGKVGEKIFYKNKRTVGENTICYYPLTNDLKDVVSGNTATYRKGGISQDGISAKLSGGALGWNLGKTFSLTGPRTIFQILKPTNRRDYSSRLGYPTINKSVVGGFEIWETRRDTGGSHPRFGITEGTGSWNNSNGHTMPLNEWHIFCLVYTGTNLYCYKDGIISDYSPVVGSNSFKPTGTASFMRFSVNNEYDYYDGYVAHLGVENKAWTQGEVKNFCETFKSLYV